MLLGMLISQLSFDLLAKARFRRRFPHVPNLADELRTAKERCLNQFGTAVLVWCGKRVKFHRVCRTFVKRCAGSVAPKSNLFNLVWHMKRTASEPGVIVKALAPVQTARGLSDGAVVSHVPISTLETEESKKAQPRHCSLYCICNIGLQVSFSYL